MLDSEKNKYLTSGSDEENILNESKALAKPSVLDEIEKMSKMLVEFSDITKDVSGLENQQKNIVVNINEEKEYDNNLLVEEVEEDKQEHINYTEYGEIIPAVEQESTFLVNTLALENTVSYPKKTGEITTENLVGNEFFKVFKKRMSKGKKAAILILIIFFVILALFALVFWMLEFFGVTDFVWWNGFEPK